MSFESLAVSFRIGLAFHALNNEGGGGTNVMEPRRIVVGDTELDGISGEMIRRHILEHFVRLAERENVSLSRSGRGLVPDRGKEDLVAWMRERKLQQLDPEHYAEATHHLLETCALRDVGGYLLALEQSDRVRGTLKRDSVFEVGWLITGHPASVEMTQHAAYHPDPSQHNLFVQNQRSGVYGGVLRVDLSRVGRNDWAWHADDVPEYAVDESERQRRVDLLLRALERWMLSPGGAKQAGWLQHTGDLDGVFMLSSDGPSPFRSPVSVQLASEATGTETAAAENVAPFRVSFDPNYRDRMQAVSRTASGRYRDFTFDDQASFLEAMAQVREALSGQ